MPGLRLLVACERCGLQYDASARASGERFHCSCGTLVTVPAARSHEAAVVRCSACGAPRRGGEATCGYCDSDFTLHERDLQTICPGCMARISDSARFCHGCGQPIVPQATAGEPTDRHCPACGGERRLASRGLDGNGLAALECGACGGLWLGNEVFRHLEERARREEPADPVTAGSRSPVRPASSAGPPVSAASVGSAASPGSAVASAAARRGDPSPTADGPLYRPCVRCGRLMHRRNYGRKSGVVVDTCRSHGVWFDAGELDGVLAWLRAGGARRSEVEAELERRQLERHRGLYAPLPENPEIGSRGRPLLDLVRALGGFLGYFV